MTYVQPMLLICLVILAVAGVVLRQRRYSRFITAMTVVFLFLWSWPPFAYLLAGTLESHQPARPLPAGNAQAIVVLSGGAIAHKPFWPEDLPELDTYVRTTYASWLFKNWRPLPVLASGGQVGDPGHPVVVSEVMRRVLREQGVPDNMIWTEQRSRSTYENALYSAQLLRAKGIGDIVLVTDAKSMPRATRAFRHQGLSVIPAPCTSRPENFDWHWTHLIPNANAIRENEITLHEWVGLLWYRIRGWV